MGRLAGWLITRCLFAVAAPIDFALRWRAVRRPRGYERGFAVAVDSEYPVATALERVAEALDLIARVDPRRLARLRHDAPRIVVAPMVFAGTHWHRPRAVALQGQAVLEQPSVWLAAALIHEGTHVRLRRAGHRTTDDNRARIERRCVREEIDFLRRLALLPEYTELAEFYIAHQEASLTPEAPWYDPEAKWLAIRDATATDETPAWVLWLADQLRPTRVGKNRDRGA